MIRLVTSLFIGSFFLSCLPVYAGAMDSTSIKLSVVHVVDSGKMTLTDSAISDGLANIKMADIQNKRAVTLAALSMNANYDIAFKSANGYRLKNDAEGTLVEYKVGYDGKNITFNTRSNSKKTARLNSKEIKTGVYHDILTVIITAP